MRSRFGVFSSGIYGCSTQLMQSQRWSSVRMKTTFGRLSRRAPPQESAEPAAAPSALPTNVLLLIKMSSSVHDKRNDHIAHRHGDVLMPIQQIRLRGVRRAANSRMPERLAGDHVIRDQAAAVTREKQFTRGGQ